MSLSFAPIALFCYNRPRHLAETLDALRENVHACSTQLFVFSDGPRNKYDFDDINAVREIVHNVKGFKSVSVKEHQTNLGLANSIISGVTEIVEQYGRVIVLEDDIVLAKNGLNFFNNALDFYEDYSDVFSISAFNYQNFPIPRQYKYDVYFIPRMQCWGWATWKKKWKFADFEMSDFDDFITDDNAVFDYKKYIGPNSLSTLTSCVRDKKDVWACRWVYAHFKHRSYCVCPTISFVENIGLDGSGQNCGNQKTGTNPLLNASDNFMFSPDVCVDNEIFRQFMFRAVPGSKLTDHNYSSSYTAPLLNNIQKPWYRNSIKN